MIRVLVADDSAVQREYLCSLLKEAGNFEVIGAVRDGDEAVRMTALLRPDIVLMDCHMPGTDGLAATRLIMQQCPTPIVMNTATLTAAESSMSFDAVSSGALALVAKPVSMDAPDFHKTYHELVRTLRLMSEVKVVGRRISTADKSSRLASPPSRAVDVVAICGSTGAPGVIADILGVLDSPATPPILVVQHLTRGFAPRFADWLAGKARLPVQLAADGMRAERGHVYVAPDDVQMSIDVAGRIRLTDAPLEDGFRPSATYLFRSLARAFGARAMGVLLTGMGHDGATGLLEMRRAGARTIVQSGATCVVHGMPRVAEQLGAATDVAAPHEIAQVIKSQRSATETPNVSDKHPSTA